MTDKRICSARASKWMLALALILVLSVAISPFASAAKDSKGKGNSNDRQEAKENAKSLEKEAKENAKELKESNLPNDNEKPDESDNQTLPPSENGAQDQDNLDNEFQGQPEVGDNEAPEQPEGQDNEISEQEDNVVTEQPEEQDNEAIGQPESEAPEQSENMVVESPIDNAADVPPTQSGGPAGEASEIKQPTIVTENESTTIMENETDEAANFVREENLISASEDSVGQTIVETNDGQGDDQIQEVDGGMSDQGSSQQNQAAAGITDSGVANVSAYFSEGISLMGAGFGLLVFFQMARLWAQRKYMFQILSLTISLSKIVSPVQSFFSNANIRFHFGKIKCRTGYTKDEALNFFRECQKLPLNFDGHFW